MCVSSAPERGGGGEGAERERESSRESSMIRANAS